MIFLILYCCICYILAAGAALNTNHMPWFALLVAPFSVPVTLAFIYSNALNNTFGR